MPIEKVLEKISQDAKCLLAPASRLPKISPNHKLPEDLIKFYKNYGGLIFFEDQDYPWRIVPPDQVLHAFDVIIGEPSMLEDFVEMADFYVIVEDFNGDYLAINLSKEHNGKIIDAFHETFGADGDTPVIASSFSELLERLYQNKGGYPYWLENPDNFQDWFDE